MLDLLFYIVSAFTIASAVGLIVNKNPVVSVFCLIAALIGLAALFMLLNAYLIGFAQILLCGGVGMLLFLAFITLSKTAGKELPKVGKGSMIAGTLVAFVFVVQIVHVLRDYDPGEIKLGTMTSNTASDMGQIGKLIFTQYYFPVQMLAVLLLVAITGVIMLRKQELK